jgi:hypothetical protein
MASARVESHVLLAKKHATWCPGVHVTASFPRKSTERALSASRKNGTSLVRGFRKKIRTIKE